MNRFTRILLLLFFTFLGSQSHVAFSQKKSVSVSVESIPFGITRFSAVYFKDYISLTPVFLAESFSADPNITMEFDMKTAGWVRITGGGIHKDLIIHPGNAYRLKCIETEDVRYLENVYLNKSDANLFCDSLNGLINSFINEYNTRLFSGALANMTSQFCDSLSNTFSFVKDSLFQTYLSFQLDELRLLGKVFSSNKMFSLRFADSPFNPENPDYAYAFTELYKGRFRELLMKNKMAPARDFIHRYKGPDSLLSILSTEPFYPRGPIGEGAVLFGLTELLTDKNYTKDELLFLMNMMGDSSTYEPVKILAKNLYKKYKTPSPMDIAPRIRVENKAGMTFDIPTGFDRPVYLCFFAPQSLVMPEELAALNELKKKIKEKVHFAPVIINAEPSSLDRVQQNLKLSMELYRNIQFSVLAEFKLKSDCTCMLLTPDGKYLEPTAPLPSAPDAQKILSGLLKTFR